MTFHIVTYWYLIGNEVRMLEVRKEKVTYMSRSNMTRPSERRKTKANAAALVALARESSCLNEKEAMALAVKETKEAHLRMKPPQASQ
jgi:hypothetical protein